MEKITQNEVKNWLRSILKENINDFSVKILGSAEKSDGFIGDIVFVSLTPVNKHVTKEYNLALKCSKQSTALREAVPVRDAFLNEMHIYERVMPGFVQFHLERNGEPFDSAPTFLGKFVSDTTEIIVLENLKALGYSLWNKQKPLTKKHIEMVAREYSKLHAVSLVMQHEKPEEFAKLLSGCCNPYKKFMEVLDVQKMYEEFITDVCDLLKDNLSESDLQFFEKFKNQARYIIAKLPEDTEGLKVITHGDGWVNNFMFTYASDGRTPLKVAILDWQLTKYTSPVIDLSYLIFSCISKEDIGNINKIVETYYDNLAFFSNQLGHSLEKDYSFEFFLDDWKKYRKWGFAMGAFILKFCSSETDEISDVSDLVENGYLYADALSPVIKNKNIFKERMQYIMEYGIQNGLID